MNNTALAALALVCVVMLVLVFAFRDSLKLTLKGFGLHFAAQGKNPSSRAGAGALAGHTTTVSGDRAAAVGGDMAGDITTGDRFEGSGPKPKPEVDGKSGPSRAGVAPSTKPKPSAGNTATASGSRAAAVGGNVQGNITTGDQTRR
jgi:hypothetical protein